MAVFPKFKITNKGLNYLNRSVAEKKALTFTKFKIGDGVPSGNWEELNDIVASFKEFPVLETSVQNNKVVRIKGYFDNKGLNADKKLKEIGVYATLEGVPEEILYSYTNAGDTADTVPDENNGFFSRTFDVANYIGNATQVTYTVEQITKDFDFNTIQEMQNATFLKAGDRVHLWGKTQLGDTTTKALIITDSYNGNNDKYTLANKKIAVVINDIDNKLDKGAYQGNAQDLKDEIDGKVSKTGGTMTGRLNIRGVNESIYIINADGTTSGILGATYTNNGIFIYNDKTKKQITLNDDNTTFIDAPDLATNKKDVVGAINENYDTLQLATTADVTKSTNIWSSNILDTRNDNYTPSHYGVGVRHEFKLSKLIDLNATTYVDLVTIKKWENSSAGLVDQFAIFDGRIKLRTGDIDTDKWGEWQEVFTTKSAGGIKVASSNGGYIVYPDGRLEVWGLTDFIENESSQTITLPVAFKSGDSYVVVASQCLGSGESSNIDNHPQISNQTAGSFLIYNNNLGDSGVQGSMRHSWLAIGWWK